MKYNWRIIDSVLRDRLDYAGAVLVQGAKWCGKTTSCEQIAKSVLYMADPERRVDYLQFAETNVSRLLKGEQPRLIDEWQDAPQLWDAIRFAVDHSEAAGQYILTGSAVPPKSEAISHSGTGRIVRLTMRPMSLLESGESNGSVSLERLFDGERQVEGEGVAYTLEDVAMMICRGGWPQSVLRGGRHKLQIAHDYLDAVVNIDISRVDDVRRNPERARRLIRSYARLQGTQAGIKTIRLDMAENEGEKLSDDTVQSYVNALKKIFVIEDMNAWCPKLRNKTVVRLGDTRYFTDPSIAAAAIGATPKDLVEDTRTMGLFFEGMAIRDLRVYADKLGGRVYHYLDGSGLDCDAVLKLEDGRYGLVEIKIGGKTLIEEGAAKMASIVKRLSPDKMRKPSFCMVLVANGEYAYRRKDDGVVVCPITLLGA